MFKEKKYEDAVMLYKDALECLDCIKTETDDTIKMKVAVN